MVRLMKVELKRFAYSFSIIKYVLIASMLVFAMPMIDFINVERELITEDVIWSSLYGTSIYAPLVIAVVVGLYIGREFKQKTYFYEVMSGYKAWEMCLSKVLTSGFIISLLMCVGLAMYFVIYPVTFNVQFVARFVIIWFIMLYFSVATILYVILLRKGLWGGLIAYGRFYMLEDMMLYFLEEYSSKLVEVGDKVLTMKLWEQVIVGVPDWKNIAGVATAMVVEVVVLVVAVSMMQKEVDLS